MKGVQEYDQKIKNNIVKYLDKHIKYKETVKSFLNCLGTDKSLNTKYQYAREVVRFLEWEDGIESSDVKNLINKLNVGCYIDYYAKFDDKTNSYRNMIYAALSSFSEYLLITEQCSEDYMKKVKAPKNIDSQETVEKRENGFLTEDEIRLFIDNIKNGVGNNIAKEKQRHWQTRDLFLLAFMLMNGPRVSAVAKMDVNDVKTENGVTFIITTEKRGKVCKYYLNDDLRIMLEEYLEFRKEYLGDNYNNVDALFISNQQRRITSQSIYALVKKYSADIKKISPHKLRATYATQLYKQTHDIFFVQQGMGHSSSQTTSLYIRGEKEEIRKKSVELMNDLVLGK